jgi:hypothetical protein
MGLQAVREEQRTAANIEQMNKECRINEVGRFAAKKITAETRGIPSARQRRSLCGFYRRDAI